MTGFLELHGVILVSFEYTKAMKSGWPDYMNGDKRPSGFGYTESLGKKSQLFGQIIICVCLCRKIRIKVNKSSEDNMLII